MLEASRTMRITMLDENVSQIAMTTWRTPGRLLNHMIVEGDSNQARARKAFVIRQILFFIMQLCRVYDDVLVRLLRCLHPHSLRKKWGCWPKNFIYYDNMCLKRNIVVPYVHI